MCCIKISLISRRNNQQEYTQYCRKVHKCGFQKKSYNHFRFWIQIYTWVMRASESRLAAISRTSLFDIEIRDAATTQRTFRLLTYLGRCRPENMACVYISLCNATSWGQSFREWGVPPNHPPPTHHHSL